MPLRRLMRSRNGGVAIMAAAIGALACVLAAIVVDLAGVALAGRTLQGAADLAALSAASYLERAQLAAETTAQANLADVQTRVVVGVYTPDPERPAADRFTPGASNPNAARVSLTRDTPLYFGRWILGRPSLTLTRTAVAARPSQPPLAMFSIGSRLARLDGGVANQLLSGLTGSSVSLSLMDYRALADADVSLLGAFDAFAVDLGVEAGRYDQLLDRSIDVGRALEIVRGLAGDQADSVLSKLVTPASGITVRLGDIVGVKADASSGLAEGLDASVSAMDLAMAMLETGGDRQIRFALGAQPGLADVTVDLAIGERPAQSPWLTVTDDRQPIVRTAQARLYVRARTSQKLSGLAQVELPILIELAPSEGRLNAVACDPEAVELGVRPGLATVALGRIQEEALGDFTRDLSPSPATLLDVVGVVRVKASAEVEIADPTFRRTNFSAKDIADQTVRTVTAANLASGLMSSLFSRLNVSVQALGLGLGLGGLTSALNALVAPLGPVLDTVIQPILELAGLKLGEADVRVHGVSCPDATAPPTLVG